MRNFQVSPGSRLGARAFVRTGETARNFAHLCACGRMFCFSRVFVHVVIERVRVCVEARACVVGQVHILAPRAGADGAQSCGWIGARVASLVHWRAWSALRAGLRTRGRARAFARPRRRSHQQARVLACVVPHAVAAPQPNSSAGRCRALARGVGGR